MSEMVKYFFSVIKSPTLYKLPGNVNYQMNILESLPTFILNSMSLTYGVLKWTCLLWFPIVYRRFYSQRDPVILIKFGGLVSILYCSSLFLQYCGRKLNSDYRRFYTVLNSALKNPKNETILNELAQYDFEFWAWPSQFNMSKFETKRKGVVNDFPRHAPLRSNFNPIMKPFCYILAQTIGVRLAYPGSTGIINALVGAQLRDARTALISQHKIKRIKLTKSDGHEIEAFYVDRRNDPEFPLGNILVVCSEGNAGFPEIGTPTAPLKKGYSVIGWHHPGFQGSTGLPFPEDEQKSIDCILQYSLHDLQFKPEGIILYAWSIGGYVSTWAAMNYPQLRSVVLDATFDNLDLLAEKALPSVFYPLVLETSKMYMDLNNVDQLKQYNGPVRLIRRTKDEMITTGDHPDLKSNRGTYLLMELLKHRYPKLFTGMNEDKLYRHLIQSENRRSAVNCDECESIITKYLSSHDNIMTYPTDMGADIQDEETKTNLLYYLASKYMEDYDSTHCTPLPPDYFKEGWRETDLI